MPNDGFVLYNVGKDLYRVADKDVKAFESENPDASIKYSTDDYDFDIPLSQREEFLKDVPNATFSQYDDKQWQKSKGKDWAPSKYAGLSYDELLKTEEAQRRYAVPFIEDYEKRSQAFMTNSRGLSNPDEAKWLQENLARYEANKADYTDLMRSITKHPEYGSSRRGNDSGCVASSCADSAGCDLSAVSRREGILNGSFSDLNDHGSSDRRFLGNALRDDDTNFFSIGVRIRRECNDQISTSKLNSSRDGEAIAESANILASHLLSLLNQYGADRTGLPRRSWDVTDQPIQQQPWLLPLQVKIGVRP